MIQLILELDLAKYPSSYPGSFDAYEFERHEREQLNRLAPGSFVRLRVGQCRPHCTPDLFRRDLVWQIIGSDTYALTEWHELLEGVPVGDY